MGACVGSSNRVPVNMKTEGSSRKATDCGMHHKLRRVSSWRFDQLREWSNQGMSLTPKQKQRRNKILGELVASETSYVRSLHQIYDEYLDPLFDQDMIGENFYLLFGVVDCLINFHELFLQSLSEGENDLFEVMDRFCDDLTLYSLFVKQYDDIISSVVELRARDRRVDHFFTHQTQQPHIQPLDSLLLMPIQRVPRYQLLFKDLVKATPTDFWDYEKLKHVLEKFGETSSTINNAREQAEREARLVNLQNKVKECPFPIFSTKRRLISENTILEHSKERWLETCNDRLIICDKDWAYRRHINMDEITSYKADKETKTLNIFADDSRYEFIFVDEKYSELCQPLPLLLKELDKSKVERKSMVQMVERDMKETQNRSSASWKQLVDNRMRKLLQLTQDSEYFGHNYQAEALCESPNNRSLEIPEPRRLQMSKSYSKMSKRRENDDIDIPDTEFFFDFGTELSDSGEVSRVHDDGHLPVGKTRRRRKKNRSLIQLHKNKKRKTIEQRSRKQMVGTPIGPQSKPSRKVDTNELKIVTPKNMPKEIHDASLYSSDSNSIRSGGRTPDARFSLTPDLQNENNDSIFISLRAAVDIEEEFAKKAEAVSKVEVADEEESINKEELVSKEDILPEVFLDSPRLQFRKTQLDKVLYEESDDDDFSERKASEIMLRQTSGKCTQSTPRSTRKPDINIKFSPPRTQEKPRMVRRTTEIGASLTIIDLPQKENSTGSKLVRRRTQIATSGEVKRDPSGSVRSLTSQTSSKLSAIPTNYSSSESPDPSMIANPSLHTSKSWTTYLPEPESHEKHVAEFLLSNTLQNQV